MGKIFALAVVGALLLGAGPASGQTVHAPAPPAPVVGSAAGILFELESGTVLWSKDDRAVRAPASLTKILTALVVLENGDLDSIATITPEARYAPGGRIYAEEGWTFTVRDLLYGLLLQSGNDAAVALAQKVSADGTVATFVDMMNDKAQRLGAMDSQFMNPHGMDEPGHVTTVRDLAIITTAAMKQPQFREIVASQTKEIPWGSATQTLTNHNKLLWRYEGAIGIKTGFTTAAGHCLISAVTRGDTTLVTILLGSPEGFHYDESIWLYDWAFGNLEVLRMSPLAHIKPSTRTASSNDDPVKDLEIVQLDPDSPTAAPKTDPTSAPLLFPLLALGVASAVGIWFTKRRMFQSTWKKM